MITVNKSINSDNRIKKTYVFGLLITILFFISVVTGNNVFSYLGALLIVGFSIKSTIARNIQLYFFMLPNIAFFKFNTDAFAMLSIISIIIFLKMLANKRMVYNTIYLGLIILYLSISMLSYFIEGIGFGILTQEIRVAVDMIMVFSISNIYKKEISMLTKSIAEHFIIGSLLMGLTALIYQYGFNMIDYSRLTVINGDPNYFALCMSSSISMITIYGRGGKFTFKQLVLYLALLFLGLLSYSRGFIIAMIPNIIAIIILRNRIKLKYYIVFTLILSVFFTLNVDFISDLWNELLSRFTLEEYKGGSGRLEIWIYYIRYYIGNFKNIVIGIGKPTLMIPGWGEKVQHNIYLELITGKGILGTIIILSIYRMLFKQIKMNFSLRKIDLISYLPLITVGVAFLFLNGLVSDIGIMSIALSFYVAAYSRKKYIESNKLRGNMNE